MKTFTRITTLILMIIPLCMYAQENSSDALKTIVIHEPFTKINASGTFHLSIEQANEPSISFKNNLEKEVVYSVKNETLNLELTSGDVTIKVKNLTEIKSSDVVVINSIGTLNYPNLTIHINDASTQNLNVSCENINATTNDASVLNIQGKSLNLNITTNDASKVKAIQLEAENIKTNLHDASKAWVNAKESVVGNTNDVSTLYYFKDAKTIKIQSNDVSKSKKMDNLSYEDTDDSSFVGSDSLNNLVTDILIEIDSSFKDGTQKNKSKWLKNPFNKKRFDGNWGGLMLGFNNYVNYAGEMDVPVGYEYLDLNFGGSRTFALNLIEQNFSIIRNKFGITTGIGFQWYNYRFAKNAQIFANQPMINGALDTVNISKYKKSKLGYTTLNIPLLLEFQTNANHNRKSFHINAGLIFGVKLSSSTKTIIDDGATTKIKTSDNFYLNPIRLDATVGIGYGIINLFASYSLTPLFKEKEGPKLYPVTAGIYLALW